MIFVKDSHTYLL
jgi:hypothetical protein